LLLKIMALLLFKGGPIAGGPKNRARIGSDTITNDIFLQMEQNQS